MAYTVGLPIGHGENTYEKNGSKATRDADGKVWEEFWFNEAVGKIAYYRLKEHGFKVVLPQKWDANEVSLRYKSNMLNEEETDLNVAIHANASGAKTANGACVFYWGGSENGKRAADLWKKHFAKDCTEIGLHGSGQHVSKRGSWTNFHIVRETIAPTILIEHGFFTNASDLKNLKNPGFQKRAAEVIVKAVCEYFGITYKKEKKEVTAGDVYYRVVTGSFEERENAEQRIEELKDAGFDSFLDVYKK